MQHAETLLKECNALMKGHFVLTSGLHSEYYVQCARLFEFPWQAEKLCRLFTSQITKLFGNFDLIISPAFGGIFFGHELARLFHAPHFFLERENGKFALRRNFQIHENAKILIAEDVVTTGKSIFETIDCLKDLPGEIVGIISVIDRSRGSVKFNYPWLPFLTMDFPTYHPDDLPQHLKEIPAIKPGSRNTTNTSLNNQQKRKVL